MLRQTACTIALAVASLLVGEAAGQDVLHLPRREDKPGPELLDAPQQAEDGKNGNGAKTDHGSRQGILPPTYPGGMYPAIPVTLPEVLKLAVLANLDIVQANLVVERAQVALMRARAQFLPDLTAGGQHLAHDGAIQATAGNIQNVDRDSLFVGGGTAITFNTSSVLFGLGQAKSLLEATRQGQNRITLEALGRVIDAYFAALRARRQLARLDEVLEILTSEQGSELRAKSPGLLPLIKAHVTAGSALPSDLSRVEADVIRRQGERALALQDVRTASAELSRLLHLNAAYFLLPAEDYRGPLAVPGEKWFVTPIEGLVEQALSAERPDLAENQALIRAAVLRYKEAKWRPLLPQIQAGLDWGGFGGGPAVMTNPKGKTFMGDSGNITNFDVRTDLNLAVVWRLENMGLGTAARIRDARIQQQQAEVQQLFLRDLVVAQVVQSMEGVQRGVARYNIYRAGLFDDAGQRVGTVYRSLRLNFLRIRDGQGTPLEVLDSTRRLSDVLQGYADAVTDYDRARYRLLLALGIQPATLLEGPPPTQIAPTVVAPPVVRCKSEATVVRGVPAAPVQPAAPPDTSGLPEYKGVPLPPIGGGAR